MLTPLLRRALIAGVAGALGFGGLRAAVAASLDEAWSNPTPEARIRAYWWWLNGNVDAPAITRDLEQMKAKGFGGALICDAGGAEQRGNDRVPAGPTFGSPAWRGLLRHALNEGDRLGLELSLSIQSGWNLGGPGVSADDAVKKLVWTEAVIDGGGEVALALPQPKVVGGYYRDLFVIACPLRAEHPPSGGVANWRQKSLQEKLKFTGPSASFLTNSAPPTDALVRSESDRPGEQDVDSQNVRVLGPLAADGTFRWAVPAGRWLILRFGCTLGDVHDVSTHSDGWAGYAIDVFNREAFQRYADSVVVPLLTEMGRHPSLRYLHTDSWEVDLINWTPGLRDEFRRRRGYDPFPFLPAFAGRIVDSRSTTNRFLNDFRRTLGDLAADNHYAPFKELAARFGLGIHPESGGPHYTPIDAQRCLGMDDVPMSEFWAQSPQHRTTEQSRFFVKQPASAAHTYGRRFVAAEGFTTIGMQWQETLWDNLKPSFDHAIAEGLNRLVWHAFVCSPASMGLPGQQYFAGTHLNPNVTWWDYSDPFFAYLNRCQAMMQRGRFVADVLYYYGDHVPNFTQFRTADPARIGFGYEYDVITAEALLTRVAVKDGRIVLPDGMTYRVLVLPDQQIISAPVLRKVGDLVAAGAIVVGPRPGMASSLSGQPAADQEVRALAAGLWDHDRVITGKPVGEALTALGVGPDFAIPAALPANAIDWTHRTDGDTEIYFVANRRGEPVAFDAEFRVRDRAPELWDAVSGGRRFAAAYRPGRGRDTTLVPLDLQAYGSTFVVFRAPASAHPATGSDSNAGNPERLRELTGPWEVHFDARWGGPETITFERLTDWTEHSDPGIRHYSGRATYRKNFEWTDATNAAGLTVDLGVVRELADVRLNGERLGVVWAPPFQVDASRALKPGTNVLEVTVVNFWPNRIIGDAALPPEKRVTRTNILQLKAGTPLMPSGLLGPVVLLRAGQSPVPLNRP